MNSGWVSNQQWLLSKLRDTSLSNNEKKTIVKLNNHILRDIKIEFAVQFLLKFLPLYSKGDIKIKSKSVEHIKWFEMGIRMKNHELISILVYHNILPEKHKIIELLKMNKCYEEFKYLI